jgi:hypothetical protein
VPGGRNNPPETTIGASVSKPSVEEYSSLMFSDAPGTD